MFYLKPVPCIKRFINVRAKYTHTLYPLPLLHNTFIPHICTKSYFQFQTHIVIFVSEWLFRTFSSIFKKIYLFIFVLNSYSTLCWISYLSIYSLLLFILYSLPVKQAWSPGEHTKIYLVCRSILVETIHKKKQAFRDTGIQGYRDTGILGYRDT